MTVIIIALTAVVVAAGAMVSSRFAGMVAVQSVGAAVAVSAGVT
jgi:hypothetical protein